MKSKDTESIDQNSLTIVLTTKEAEEDYIVALKGMFQCSIGSKAFKSKVWSLIKILEPKIKENMKKFFDCEEQYHTLVNIAKNTAMIENKQYIPNENIINKQGEYYKTRNECFDLPIELQISKSNLFSIEDFPSEEELTKLPPYMTMQIVNGYQQTLQHSLVGLLAILEYKFLNTEK